jgi:GT2 family glycosyltransferase
MHQRQIEKVVCIITALWGETGSTSVFDAQTRYFLENGYFVVRLFVEHWEKSEQREKLVNENFRYIKPHLHLIAVRQTQHEQPRGRSSVGRSIDAISMAKPIDANLFRWVARTSDIVVVNHTIHMGFAKRHFKAPIILETHDVLSELFNIHGVPDFASKGEDSPVDRLDEELHAISMADHCICFSHDDRNVFQSHAASISVIKPYARDNPTTSEDWQLLAKKHKLNQRLRKKGFDLTLWGDLHQGNVSSCTAFINQCLPLLKKFRPTIAIAGRLSEVLPKELLGIPQIYPLGRVSNLKALISNTRIAVLYDAAGTGLSIKTMETLSWGHCFSATIPSFRSLVLGDKSYTPASGNVALASDIKQLLANESKRSERAQLAAEIYKLNFSKEVYDRSWSRAIQALRQRKRSNANSTRLPLSIIICTYDRYDMVVGAVQSCLKQKLDKSQYEIIVVDNFANPDKFFELRRKFENERNVRIVTEVNRGLSHARNRGTREARGNIVAFIDDDARADYDWSTEILKGFSEFPNEVTVQGGTVLPIWRGDRPKWVRKRDLHYFSLVDWRGQLREVEQGEWLVGCNIAFTKSALTAVGGFSTNLGRIGDGSNLLSNEETELIDRVRLIGGTIIYNPSALVMHVVEAQRVTQRWLQRRAAWQAVSDFLSDPEKARQFAENLRNKKMPAQSQKRQNKTFEPPLPTGKKQSENRLDVYEEIILLLDGWI